MTRFVFVAVVLLTGAATASAGIAPRMMFPYRDPPPFAATYHVAMLLPFAGVAGEPATLTVQSLQSITVSEPGSGGPCGSPDRFSMPSESAEPIAPSAGGGTPLWVPIAAGGVVVGGLAALGLWLLCRTRGA